MTTLWEHCMGDLPEDWPQRRPKAHRTLGVYPDRYKAQRVLSDLLGGSPAEGYHVTETEAGWAIVREAPCRT